MPVQIEIKKSTFGRGLFTKTSIAPFTIICGIKGERITFADTLLLGEQESHAVQIGFNEYILIDPPFLFCNHSCTPNCAINKDLQVFALRRIKRGEELLWDYTTSMLERHWTMKCFCGTDACRKVISDFDLLPENIQEDYLRRNMVLPFIVQHLAIQELLNT